MTAEGVRMCRSRLACFAVILAAAALSVAQEKKPFSSNVDGHIFRPGETKPTDELIAKQLKVPAGFKVSKFAEGLGPPRILPGGGDRTRFVSRRIEGDVLALPDKDANGKADDVRSAWRLPEAHGLAIHDGKLYVATINEVYAAPIQPG